MGNRQTPPGSQLGGRKPDAQVMQPRRFGLKEYATPSGGCLLTDPGYCRRLKELRGKEGWIREELVLIRHGRHFRLDSGARAVSGRDREENEVITRMARPGELR